MKLLSLFSIFLISNAFGLDSTLITDKKTTEISSLLKKIELAREHNLNKKNEQYFDQKVTIGVHPIATIHDIFCLELECKERSNSQWEKRTIWLSSRNRDMWNRYTFFAIKNACFVPFSQSDIPHDIAIYDYTKIKQIHARIPLLDTNKGQFLITFKKDSSRAYLTTF